MNIDRRVVVWFSCGAASAVAAKITLQNFASDRVVIAYCATGSEHEDNTRFKADCERWFGKKIETIKSEDYLDTWDVWTKRQFLRGPHGAACTSELKIAPRVAFQKPTDIHVFGYTSDSSDIRRAERFRENYPELSILTPLIENGIDKPATLALIASAGIEIPKMYKLGFHNNNCLTCVKASSPGYWSLVRQSFPADFQRMASLSRKFRVRLARIRGERVFLDEIPSDFPVTEPIAPACDFMCHVMETELVTLGVSEIEGLIFDEDFIQDKGDGILIGICRQKANRPTCNKCGSFDLTANGTRKVKYRDSCVGEKFVTLVWDRQRFMCDNCKSTTPDFHPGLKNGHMMTTRLFEQILLDAKTQSFAKIARKLKLDEKTIRNVVKSAVTTTTSV